MKNVHFKRLAATQLDVVALWQLEAMGLSRRALDDHAWRHGWRRVHDGVYLLTQAPITRRQRWMAACLTAPASVLAGASAGACHGFFWRDPAIVTVVRPGSGGPKRFGGVVVRRSTALAAEVDWCGEIPVTTPERTLIDLSPHLSEKERAKAVRECIRLRKATPRSLLSALDRHRGWRGTVALRELAMIYLPLPLHRARSDAESLALERLFRAGLPIPRLNEKVGEYEADLIDHERRLIVEIDGPANHLFPAEDAKRDAAWADAGYTVRRLPSDAVYR